MLGHPVTGARGEVLRPGWDRLAVLGQDAEPAGPAGLDWPGLGWTGPGLAGVCTSACGVLIV